MSKPQPVVEKPEELPEKEKAKAKVIDSAWQQHMATYHGMERRHGSFRRSVRHAHQALDLVQHEPTFDLHETIIEQGDRWVRGRMNDNGTPLMVEEAVRYMNQSFNADRGRDWLTPQEICTILQLRPGIVYRILRKKLLPCYRPGGQDGKVLIKVVALEAYMKASDYSAGDIAAAAARAREITSAKQTA